MNFKVRINHPVVLLPRVLAEVSQGSVLFNKLPNDIPSNTKFMIALYVDNIVQSQIVLPNRI